ncbi:MAG: DUF5946 family protein [Bryobacteraceae bacterium]|jgi:hypothetical protein
MNDSVREGNPEMTPEEAIGELYAYTLARRDSDFIHQYAVDAFTAQMATADTKPMTVAFALIGLYLCLEHGYTGRHVQLAHMRLAKLRTHWPAFALPESRGEITVFDVLRAPPGNERDLLIKNWCASVWQAWAHAQSGVRELYVQVYRSAQK